MRALHSVLSLQPESLSNIKILWERSRYFNCSIYELFNVPGEILVEEWAMNLLHRAKCKLSGNIQRPALSKFKHDLILNDQDIIKLREEKYDFRNLLNYKSVYIETCQWFYTGTERFIYFQPNPEIADQVDSVTRNFDEHIIGIHVRRTDHPTSQIASPLSEFKKIMKAEINRNRNTVFFLSTDSKEVEKKLLDEFKSRILSLRNKELSRSSAKGIKDAFVDMLCLSQTNKIYGSYHSTFSHIASLMNDVELQVVNVLHR